MPALTVALAFLKGGLGWLWEFLSSHFGQLVTVALVAWFWSAHRTNIKWQARVAAEQAAAVSAAQAEAVRQAQAAQEIAEAATDRLVEEQALARDLQAQVSAFDKEENVNDTKPASRHTSCTPVIVRPCRVDDRFADSVRGVDAGAHRRAPVSARRSR